ncbi:MAG: phosphatase PAP2 family protein [Patescibacteria group bacterium]|nr:phosphatase PAP2 family protein [Patescibacteria group bacterium]
MSKKLQYAIYGISIFLIFVFFSYLVHKNLFTRFDFDTTVKLQNHAKKIFDDLSSWLSVIGGFEVATIILIIFLIYTRRLLGFIVLFIYGLIHVFELYGKTFVNHLPPPFFMVRTEKFIEFPQFYVRTENSYPSGHAARATFISILICLFTMNSKKLSKNQKYIILGFVLIYDFAMFASRPYLGEHWMSDVIGGMLLGLGLGLISYIFIQPKS